MTLWWFVSLWIRHTSGEHQKHYSYHFPLFGSLELCADREVMHPITSANDSDYTLYLSCHPLLLFSFWEHYVARVIIKREKQLKPFFFLLHHGFAAKPGDQIRRVVILLCFQIWGATNLFHWRDVYFTLWFNFNREQTSLTCRVKGTKTKGVFQPAVKCNQYVFISLCNKASEVSWESTAGS